MNASDLKAVADAVNAKRAQARQLSFETIIAKAEKSAQGGDYDIIASFYDHESGVTQDLLSKEVREKLVARGFWLKSSDYYSWMHVRWDKKPWWRFWS